MAILYDSMLLIGIIFAFGVIVFLLRKLAGDDTMQAPSNILQVFITLGMWLSCIYFYVLCWVRRGQTLGMKSWKLHLYSQKQQDLTMTVIYNKKNVHPAHGCLCSMNHDNGLRVILWCPGNSDGFPPSRCLRVPRHPDCKSRSRASKRFAIF